MRRVRKYKGVDGRIHWTDDEPRKLEPRKSMIAQLEHFEAVSAIDVWRCEGFLQAQSDAGTPLSADQARRVLVGQEVSWGQSDRRRVVREYGLVKEDPDKPKSRWVGDKSKIFQKFLEKYPSAANYQSYQDVLYAMRYGDDRSGEVTVVPPEASG